MTARQGNERSSSNIEARFVGNLKHFRLNAEFSLPGRGLIALFGQSGCGKTTILRCLAGLIRMKEGYLRVGEEIWQDANQFLPPHKRRIGYVFQEPSLFSHLSVRRNLAFGARRRKGGRDGPSRDEVIALLGLDPLLDRATRRLSGGERQRVAIGRALLAAPRLLLMDEPLSGLDRFSKDEIIPYLEALNDSLSIPIFYVSHDTTEVERLAEHMILMEKGEVRAAGPLLEILTDPSLFIAQSPKTASVLKARVAAFDETDQLTELEVAGGKLMVPGRVAELGTRPRIRIAASDVSLASERPSRTTILNILRAKIIEIHPIDSGRVNILLGLGPECEARVIARITMRSLKAFGFKAGQEVFAQVKGISMIQRGPMEKAETSPPEEIAEPPKRG